MSEKKLQALIKLLADKNKEIFLIVEAQLLQRGIVIIPELEEAWKNTTDKFLQHRLESIIHNIQTSKVHENLIKWSTDDNNDLLLGAYYVALYQSPHLKFNDLSEQIDLIINDLEPIFNTKTTPLEKVKALNHVMFQNYKFIQNSNNFFAPQNSYINKVLETKRGNSTSIAIIYITVARSFGLPVFGVNLPRNFIVAYTDEANPESDSHILFYINPVNRGAVLGRKEIDYYLKQIKMKQQGEYYSPCTNKVIIDRLLLNLVDAYDRQGHKDKIKDVEKLLEIIRKKQ